MDKINMDELENLNSSLKSAKEKILSFQKFISLSSSVFIEVDNNARVIEALNFSEYVYKKTPEKGESLEKCVHYDLYAALIGKIGETCSTGQKQSFEIPIESSSDKTFWFSVALEPAEDQISILIKDITSIKQKHQREIENDRLATLGVMTGGIAHQFNNIHNVVLGSLECLNFIDDEQTKDELCDMAIKNIKKASHLTARLLNFAKAKEGEVVLHDLEDCVQSAFSFVEEQFEEYGGSFELVNKTDGAFYKVKVEPSLIEQVLINIYINGLHAMAGEAVRHITTTIHADNEGQKIFCDITDTGCGISIKDIRKIFTPLFSTKGEFSTSRGAMASIKGAGLGLAISKKIMKEMGGDVELLKTSDKGSTFRLSFPLLTMETVKKLEFETVVNEQALPPKLKVMILEDSVENRNLVKFYLKAFPECHIQEYENGRVSRQELIENGPDYILLDWLMPEVGGDEFLAQVAKWRPEMLERVGIITANINEPSLAKWKSKVKFVLRKPVTRNNLIRSLTC